MKKLAFTPDANSVGHIENASDYVDSVVLAASVAKSFAKPTGARFVRLSSSVQFEYSTSGAAAVIAVADITNGSSSVSSPVNVRPFFCIDDVISVSVVAASACVVTAEFWG